MLAAPAVVEAAAIQDPPVGLNVPYVVAEAVEGFQELVAVNDRADRTRPVAEFAVTDVAPEPSKPRINTAISFTMSLTCPAAASAGNV